MTISAKFLVFFILQNFLVIQKFFPLRMLRFKIFLVDYLVTLIHQIRDSNFETYESTYEYENESIIIRHSKFEYDSFHFIRSSFYRSVITTEYPT